MSGPHQHAPQWNPSWDDSFPIDLHACRLSSNKWLIRDFQEQGLACRVTTGQLQGLYPAHLQVEVVEVCPSVCAMGS